jgi:NADPH:quinone reductase-like Zn-dependent oxidoreductase
MTGLRYLIRVVVPTLGLRKPKVPVRGMDVAGTVEAVGPNVTRCQPGDEVFGWCDGSYAEYACAPEDHFAPKPTTLSFRDARHFDLILDTAGHCSLSRLRRALTPAGNAGHRRQ